MYGHLIAVEIGVKSGTYQWVQLDRFAFDENRLECLNAKTVKRWGAVEKDAVILNDLLENVPDLGPFSLD